MAKYRITPSSRTIVQSPISIGHKAEKGVEAIEFDLTAWVETYGSGTLTVIMRRWGDAIPYPVALEIDENNKATWTLSGTDTAKAGMAYAQLSYIVGDEVMKKSDIYTFRVMDSLTGEGEPPEAYESWLEHLTHLAAEAMAEVLDIEGIVTDKTLTVDGGIADGKATGDALALKADKSTTYTKTEVDQMIEDVEVETDTTLAIPGAPADAKKVGDELSDIKADLGTIVGGGDTTEALTFTTGKYINTGGSGVNIGDTIDVSNPSTYNLLKYAIAECSEGDRFLLNVKGAASGRAWAFLTSANVLISRADASVTLRDFYITAPANAGKIVINDNFEQGTTGGTAYKVIAGAGKGAVVRFDTAQNLTDSEKYQARENIGVSISADGLSYEAKSALLTCFEHVALWDDGYGEAYISTLRNALFNVTYPGIVATYDNTYTVLVGNAVSVLKKYLTVKYYANESSSGETVSENDYTLAGTINSSSNTISASYNGYVSTFAVSAVAVNNIRKIEYPNNTMLKTTLGYYTVDGRVSRHGMRRCIYMSSGIAEAGLVATTNPTTVDENGAYLIQVPSWATKVTVTITPATYQLAIIMYTYTAQSTTKTWAKQLDWTSGGIGTLSFTENSNYLMGIFYRISDTTDLTNLDADNVKIEFE